MRLKAKNRKRDSKLLASSCGWGANSCSLRRFYIFFCMTKVKIGSVFFWYTWSFLYLYIWETQQKYDSFPRVCILDIRLAGWFVISLKLSSSAGHRLAETVELHQPCPWTISDWAYEKTVKKLTIDKILQYPQRYELQTREKLGCVNPAPGYRTSSRNLAHTLVQFDKKCPSKRPTNFDELDSCSLFNMAVNWNGTF